MYKSNVAIRDAEAKAEAERKRSGSGRLFLFTFIATIFYHAIFDFLEAEAVWNMIRFRIPGLTTVISYLFA